MHRRDPSYACRLKMALNGLKRVPRAWYFGIDGYLLGLSFNENEAKCNVCCALVDGDSLILVLYIEDLFMKGLEKLIEMCKKNLALEFKMKNIGLMHYFLGLEVWQ